MQSKTDVEHRLRKNEPNFRIHSECNGQNDTHTKAYFRHTNWLEIMTTMDISFSRTPNALMCLAPCTIYFSLLQLNKNIVSKMYASYNRKQARKRLCSMHAWMTAGSTQTFKITESNAKQRRKWMIHVPGMFNWSTSYKFHVCIVCDDNNNNEMKSKSTASWLLFNMA